MLIAMAIAMAIHAPSNANDDALNPAGDVNGVVGIYEVPTGELIVWIDRSAQYIPFDTNRCHSAYKGMPGEDSTVIQCD